VLRETGVINRRDGSWEMGVIALRLNQGKLIPGDKKGEVKNYEISNPSFCISFQKSGYDLETTSGLLMSMGNEIAKGAKAMAMRWSW